MRGVGGGKLEEGGRGDMKQITAHSNPYPSFSLSFFPLCIRRGFDEKIPHVAVQKFRVIFHKIRLYFKECHHGMNDSYLRLY